MMNGKYAMVVAMVTVLVLMSAASAWAFSYFEDFEGVPSGTSITALGWIDKAAGVDVNVVTGDHAAWTGNYVRGKTSPDGGVYYESLGAGVPTTGNLNFACKAWSTNPYDGVNYYYGSGTVGLGDAAGENLVNWWGGSSNTDLWVFDARGMGATYEMIWTPGLRGTYWEDVTVQLQIVVDQTSKLLWGVVDNGHGVRVETAHMSYASAAIGSVRIVESNYDWKDYGIDVDDISVTSVPEPGSLLAMATGLMGVAGMAIRRRR
jgi:hypothetical protein